MRTLITEATLPDFHRRLTAFHDAHFLSIDYDFDAGTVDNYMHRLTVRVSTPDWILGFDGRPPKRIEVVFEIEGEIDYILLKKPDNRSMAIIDEIDIYFDGDITVLDFLPYHENHPMRGSKSIHTHYETKMPDMGATFVARGRRCYWSVKEP